MARLPRPRPRQSRHRRLPPPRHGCGPPLRYACRMVAAAPNAWSFIQIRIHPGLVLVRRWTLGKPDFGARDSRIEPASKEKVGSRELVDLVVLQQLSKILKRNSLEPTRTLM